MTDYTIANEYTLPSEGKVYSKPFDPHVRLRSMTTVQELKRLNYSQYPYRAMSEIIDDCLIEKLPISAYDLNIVDYQYLLHKLRIVTYGPNYKLSSSCPFCGSNNTNVINLDEMNLINFDEKAFKECSEFELPVSKKHIKIRMQTPRILDDIAVKSKDPKHNSGRSNQDTTFILTLESLIDTIDEERPEQFKIVPFLQKLAMMDTNYILKSAQKLNSSFGISSEVNHVCSVCGLTYTGKFRTTSEFFGPSID